AQNPTVFDAGAAGGGPSGTGGTAVSPSGGPTGSVGASAGAATSAGGSSAPGAGTGPAATAKSTGTASSQAQQVDGLGRPLTGDKGKCAPGGLLQENITFTSPPCMPAFAGANGGNTYAGVT